MKNRPLFCVCLAVLLILCLAVLGGGEKLIKELRPSALEEHLSSGERVAVQGRVYWLEQKQNSQTIYLKDNSIWKYQEYQNKKQLFHESNIILYTDSNLKLNMGNTIRAEGEVSFFENARNPGNFNQKRYYQRQDIHGMIWAEKLKVEDSAKWPVRSWLGGLKQRVKDNLMSVMGEKDGNTLAAMMLGDRAQMDTDLKTLYQRNGIGHILAISGLHLSFIGLGVYWILRRLTGSYLAAGAAGILFLSFYILMIGLTVSAVRALVMFLFRVGADMTGRHYDAPTALAAAAAVVLIWRPLYLYDGGFWLSFSAVIAVIAVLPVFRKMPFQSLWASVSIQITILPVILFCYFEIPPYSVLLNLLVIPLMSALLFFGMAGSVLYGILPAAGELALELCKGILWLYEKACGAAMAIPGSRVVVGRPELWQIFLYYFFLVACLFLWKNKKYYHRIASAFVFALSVFLLSYRFGESGQMTVTVLDVGQGDGIFIKGPQGGAYLVDGGSSDVKKAGQYRIEPFLKSQGIGSLDCVFISHGDSDHINGVQELIERREIGVKIGTLVLPPQEVWDTALNSLAGQARKAGIRVAVIEPGQTVTEGGMTITCLAPGKDTLLPPGNAASMALAASYGEFDMLLTGDVEERGEKLLTETLRKRYPDMGWEVLKVAHHGSKNSSTEEFLEIVKPICAVISAGQENPYGHPHEETIKRLKTVESLIYTTQESGAVKIRVDASGKATCSTCLNPQGIP